MRNVRNDDFFDEVSDVNHDGKIDMEEEYIRNKEILYATHDKTEREALARCFGMSESEMQDIEEYHKCFENSGDGGFSSTFCFILFAIFILLIVVH